MKTIKPVNVLKVVDVNKSDVKENTIKYLFNNFITYRDEVLNEHIVNINDALEDDQPFESYWVAEEVEMIKGEIEALQKLAHTLECGYIRFIDDENPINHTFK